MFKKIILGLMTLALAIPAFADEFYGDNYNNDYYAQAPNNTCYAKAPVPVASPSPYATAYSTSGFLLGLDLGYADTHWDNITFPGLDISDSGFAARGYLGYVFNQYLGIEAGYVYLPTTDITGPGGLTGNIDSYAIDFLGKLSVPVTSGFDLFAKAGVGYLNSSLGDNSLGLTGDHSHVGPAFGVGAGYEVIPNLALNLSWMRYSGDGKIGDQSYQPNPDAVFFGLSYVIPTRNS